MPTEAPKTKIELDKDFEPTESLFHYTSSEGLFGILESNCLWATQFKFLNDNSEFFAARSSLVSFVEQEIAGQLNACIASGDNPLPDGMSIAEVSGHEAGVIVDAMYGATLNMADPFVFSSFVSKAASRGFRNGELLHWATYGREGGYAVQINPHKLAAILPKADILSLRAVYVDDAAPAELAQEYSEIGKVAREMIDGMRRHDLASVDVGKSASPFMKVASIIKDGYFRSESEARLVYMRFKDTPSEYTPLPVFIRHARGRAVPYVKLFEGTLLGDSCPIEAIIIGPHPDRERRKEALAIYLNARGLSEIEIVQSEVPYIGG